MPTTPNGCVGMRRPLLCTLAATASVVAAAVTAITMVAAAAVPKARGLCQHWLCNLGQTWTVMRTSKFTRSAEKAVAEKADAEINDKIKSSAYVSIGCATLAKHGQ
jgi:hypothetical protein